MSKMSEILFTELRGAVRHVSRMLGAAVLFAFVCQIYIVEPYFRQKAQEREIVQAMEKQTNIRTQLARELEPIQEVSEKAGTTLANIRKRIEDYPEELRKMLPEIREAILQPATPIQQQSFRPAGRFQLPADIDNFEEGVRWYVENWFGRLAADLETGVVQPVSALSADGVDDLKSETSRAMESLQRHLDGVDSEFWRSYGEGKVEVAEELKRVVEDFFGPIEKSVSALLRKTQAKIRDQEKQIENFSAELDNARAQKAQLEKRLESLESPLGRLPLGLTDLITLFPLILAAAMLILFTAVERVSRLCAVLKKRLEREQVERDDKELLLLADCWHLPPYRRLFPPLLFWGGLLFILAVFVRAGYLVAFGTDPLAGAESEFGILRGNFLLGAYAIGATVLLACLGGLAREILRARNPAQEQR